MKSTRFPKLVALITQKGYTTRELADILHCTLRSSRDMLHKLKDEGSVHIQSWRRAQANGWIAVWRYGIGVDAEKPEPLSTRARVKKCRERESIDEKEFRLARQRQLKRKVKRDPLTAAFYGDAT